jgi:pyruvate/2-oxoglutarate dehydrogenase complex dihydrolipoamide acyltransferase (E2) component
MDGKLAEGLASDVMELAGTPPKVPPTLAVRMPALGEGVAEGTVTRWLKQVGDTVAVDEPLVEVSTDKVDTEIPAPADGILLEIAAPLDSVVKVGSTLGVLVGQRSADSPGQMPGVQISMANRLARSTNPDQTIARAKALLDQHALSQAEFDLLKSHALSAWLQTLG